jgi:hypothetical protein
MVILEILWTIFLEVFGDIILLGLAVIALGVILAITAAPAALTVWLLTKAPEHRARLAAYGALVLGVGLGVGYYVVLPTPYIKTASWRDRTCNLGPGEHHDLTPLFSGNTQPIAQVGALNPFPVAQWHLFAWADGLLAEEIRCPPKAEASLGFILKVLKWIFTFPAMLAEWILKYLIFSVIWEGLVLFVLPYVAPGLLMAGAVAFYMKQEDLFRKPD